MEGKGVKGTTLRVKGGALKGQMAQEPPELAPSAWKAAPWYLQDGGHWSGSLLAPDAAAVGHLGTSRGQGLN